MPDGVAAKLAGAKTALDRANDFTKSVEGKNPSSFRQYADASYSMIRGKRPTAKPATKSTGEDAAAGIAAKRKNIDEYVRATGE